MTKSLQITIYTKNGCPACSKAKTDLNDFLQHLEKTYLKDGQKIKTIKVILTEYAKLPDGYKQNIQDKIKKQTKEEYHYYPKIFFNDQFIGGSDKLKTKIEEIKNDEKKLFQFLKKNIK